MFSILTSVAPEMYIPWVLLSLICRLSLDKSRRSLGYEEKRIDPVQRLTKYSPERNHKKFSTQCSPHFFQIYLHLRHGK